MPLLYALTLFVGAALLFSVQPMIAKMLLPLLGGTPAVWSTCMVFFQAELLAGYAYAHAATSRLGIRRQTALHAGLLVVPWFVLPLGIPRHSAPPPSSEDPTLWLLGLLITTAGLPFFLVSTTAPLLQRWFSGTGHRAAADPYYLYGASNLGSLLALLSYPFVVEPNLSLARQAALWSVGYGGLAVLTMACAVSARRSGGAASTAFDDRLEGDAERRIGLLRGLRWLAQAFLPSSLMLGLTTYLTTDIAPIPLLWVIPLGLYLLSFMLVFARRPLLPHRAMVRALPWVVVPWALVMGIGLVQAVWIPLHLLAFFVASMACHGELARLRPPARRLTAFYLAMALGGVLGGVFNALIAPFVFDRIAEYPLAMVGACAILPAVATDEGQQGWRQADVLIPAAIFLLTAALVLDLLGLASSPAGALGVMIASGLVALAFSTHRTRPVRFALAVGAALLASGLSPGVNGRPLHRERTFFGILRVTAVAEGNYHRLFQGTTLHGQQCLDPDRRREPLTYFTRSGPIGQVFDAVRARLEVPGAAVAIAGLGAGTLACYAEPGQRWTIYEIDPAVARIARDPRYFRFLGDCPAESLDVVVGDARTRLRDAPGHGFGLIVLDAFSSDAVPTHLLTREALRLYLDKLAEGGLIAFNITNRYLDLEPVVGVLALDAGLACRVRYDVDVPKRDRERGKLGSIWAVLARREADLGPLAKDPRWTAPRSRPGEAAWTDDFSDLTSHLILKLRRPWGAQPLTPTPPRS